MCVIIILEPGYTLPYEMLFNACHNNPHGYGIVIKRKEGLEVRKELPEGGNDPDVIYQILKDNEDTQRFVHVRWKTQGDVSEENVQPFEVFNDIIKIGNKKVRRHIEFMHNGTLSSYTPPYQHTNYGQQNKPSGPVASDTLRFAREVLRPFLAKLTGQNGIADIEDPVIAMMLDKYWQTGNRGILICNNLESMYFNRTAWDEVETSEIIDGKEVTGKFLASNDTYFKSLSRGPLYDKQQEEKRKKELEEKAKNSAFGRTEKPFLSAKFFEAFSISEALSDILEDFDMYKAEGYVQLANLSYYEWKNLVEKSKSDDVASMFLYLTDYLRQAHETIDKLTVLEENILQDSEGGVDELPRQANIQ